MFLGEFGLHARDGGFEEKGDEMLVCAICADLLQSRDIGSTIFETDNEQGMIGAKENEVGEQTACSAVLILLSDALVFLYFLLKHRGKDRDYFRNKQENGQKSLDQYKAILAHLGIK